MNCLPQAVGFGEVETAKAQPRHDSKLEEFQVSFLELLRVKANTTHSFLLVFYSKDKAMYFSIPQILR